jgi:hypothetical protein
MSTTIEEQYRAVYWHTFTCDQCNRRARMLSPRRTTPHVPRRWHRAGQFHACSLRCLAILSPTDAARVQRSTAHLIADGLAAIAPTAPTTEGGSQ